jgi:hypothetical protein
MGFFDTVKDKAGALAADAGRAGRVTAAQARLAVLQNDLRKAERELGHAAFALAERGQLDHPDLAPAIEGLRATAAEISAKEAEIAALRNDAPTPAGATGEAPPEATTTVETAAGPVTVTSAPSVPMPEPVAETSTPEPAPEAAAAAPPAAAAEMPTKPARRKAATKAADPVAKKAQPKKAPAASKATVKKTASKAGATPKKSSRPRSGPRPAGKNRPAGT